jgi:hypothetical protein
MPEGEKPKTPKHLSGLRRFAAAITVLNILGHTVLGFEQSWATPLVALATGYSMELLLKVIGEGQNWRASLFKGGWRGFVDALLSAHITGLACGMLLYSAERLEVIAFAVAVAIGSKAIFRVPLGKGTRHFLNPSNFGITTTLLLFPWVGVVPPYHFTENLHGWLDWLLPTIIICTGSLLNGKLTGRMPLIAAWIGGFVLQALVRQFLLGTPLPAALMPMTGVAWLLFSLYMLSDPATTPEKPWAQVAFGAAVAATYGLLVAMHIVFGLFFALTIVCVARGLVLYVYAVLQAQALSPATTQTPAPAIQTPVMPTPSLSTAEFAVAEAAKAE